MQLGKAIYREFVAFEVPKLSPRPQGIVIHCGAPLAASDLARSRRLLRAFNAA